MTRRDDRFDEIDKAALNSALLILRQCPRCRRDLSPVAFCSDVWGCGNCRETWHLPEPGDPRGWCACGARALDGKVTCGRVECRR